jgi:group I intron endonuclease
MRGLRPLFYLTKEIPTSYILLINVNLMKTVGIYKITSPDNKVYIGQSIDIDSRLKSHITNSSNRFLKESFDKHGIDKHTFEILTTCSEWELDSLEEMFILKFNATNPKFGFNISTHSNGKYRSENRKELTEFEREGEEAMNFVDSQPIYSHQQRLDFILANREVFAKSLRCTWYYPTFRETLTEDQMVDLEIKTLTKMIEKYGTQTR